MRKAYPRFLLLCVMIALSRASFLQSQPAAKLEPLGLSGKKVSTLALPYQITPAGAYLYAGTSQEGVWRLALAQSDTAWEPLGLEGKEITALDVHVWGAGPAIFYTPVAGITPRLSNADSTLIYRHENAQWLAADSGMARAGLFFSGVRALASFESSGHMPPGATLAAGGETVYRSHTRAPRWQQAFTFGLGATNALAVDRANPLSEVWAGGESAIFAPWLAKSEDNGQTWELVPLISRVNAENACRSLALHPSDANVVYAGLNEEVAKTSDRGQTWNTALASPATTFYGLVIDAANPSHVFAGGTFVNTEAWALWESFDGGATWREIAAPQGKIADRGIRSIVADPVEAGVVYIATFGDGVWKYQSSPTGVNDPPRNDLPSGFVLAQNAPNPFSRNEAAATVIRYHIPATQHLKVEIYDLLGKHVATLVDRMRASGEHAVQWNGKDVAGRVVPNGIYFYRLHAGAKTIATRKMIVLHNQ